MVLKTGSLIPPDEWEMEDEGMSSYLASTMGSNLNLAAY